MMIHYTSKRLILFSCYVGLVASSNVQKAKVKVQEPKVKIQKALQNYMKELEEKKGNAYTEPVPIGARCDKKANSFGVFDDSQWYWQIDMDKKICYFGDKSQGPISLKENMRPEVPVGVFYNPHNPTVPASDSYFVFDDQAQVLGPEHNITISRPLWRVTKHMQHDSKIKDGWTFTEHIWTKPYSNYKPPMYESKSKPLEKDNGKYWKQVMVYDMRAWLDQPKPSSHEGWITFHLRAQPPSTSFQSIAIWILVFLLVVSVAAAAYFYCSQKKQAQGDEPYGSGLPAVENVPAGEPDCHGKAPIIPLYKVYASDD